MPPAGKKDKTDKTDKPGKGAPGEKDQGTIPVEPLRKLNLDGQIDIGELVVRKMRLQNVGLTLSAHNGVLDIIPLKADLYGGTLNTTTTLDVRKKTPVMQVNHKLNGVDLDPMLQDLAGMRILSGKTDIEAALDTAGLAAGEWIRNLDGNLSFLMDEGTIRGVNIPRLVRNAIRTVKGKAPDDSGGDATDFTQLKASARLKEGIARESNLSLISPLLQLTGSGSVDLIKEIVDYSLQAKLTEKFKQQSGVDLGGTGTVDIPISLKGSLTDPKYKVDAGNLLRDLGREKIKEQVQKKVLDKLGGEGGQEGSEADKPGLDPKKMLEGIFQKQ
jgi:AsmA protein